MPTWLFRFFLELPCRPQDRDELLETAPELLQQQQDREPERHPGWFPAVSPIGELFFYPLNLERLRMWAGSVEKERKPDLPVVVDAKDCPAPDCPLRQRPAPPTQAPLPASTEDGHPEDLTEYLYRIVIAGGPGRSNSVGAFLDLVRRIKAQKSKGAAKDVYITDPYIFADVGGTGQSGGYSAIVDYLSALGLHKKSVFNIHLPSWPKRSELQKKRGDDLSNAQQTLQRLVMEAFPLSHIKRLPQKARFHDRLYLVRDEASMMTGVFGPSLNGLRSEDIALMGEIDDPHVLRLLDRLITTGHA